MAARGETGGGGETTATAVRTGWLETDLRELGLQSGDQVVVHSSFKSIGPVEGGPVAVVEALLAVLGPSGTLVLPTFTHSGTTHFDPLTSPSKNGAITEAGRRHPAAVRSWHPTHAVTAIGAAAAELVRDDLERGALGRGCALDKLARRGGWVLLIGVDHESNSTIHVGEDYGGDDRSQKISAEAPKQIELTHPAVGRLQVLLVSMMGDAVLRQHERLDTLLRDRALQREGKIGGAHCRLVRGQAVVDACVEIMKADGTFKQRM